MRRNIGIALLIAAAVGAAKGQSGRPPHLQALVDTEIEFANTAKVKGWRAAFIEFNAEDAIIFQPGPTPVQPLLRKGTQQPPSVQELIWEPRVGDVAASGDLGWLTGPSTWIDRGKTDARIEHGNYLSIWRKQANGTWRSIIDIGTKVPSAAPFPPGFTQFRSGEPRFTGVQPKAAATKALRAADERLNAEAMTTGFAAAYAAVLAGHDSRLHRQGSGTLPSVGGEAIAGWLRSQPPWSQLTTGFAEASGASDLGYTYGQYRADGSDKDSGAYVRVWTRSASGTWRLQVEAIQPVPPPA